VSVQDILSRMMGRREMVIYSRGADTLYEGSRVEDRLGIELYGM